MRALLAIPRPPPHRLLAASLATLVALGIGDLGLRPGVAAQPTDPGDPPGVVEVEVVTRVGHDHPTAWTARTRIASAAAPLRPAIAPGICRRREDDETPGDGPIADRVRLSGGLTGELKWADGAWRTLGPRAMIDPTWAVSDLLLTVDHVQVKAADAVRFGPRARVTAVERSPSQGTIRLAWDPQSAENPRVFVDGPAGDVECGTGAAGLTLPWWVVPALGGEVVLRTTRERTTTLDNGVKVHVKASIEELVPLDPTAVAPSEHEEHPGEALEGVPDHPSTRPPDPTYG